MYTDKEKEYALNCWNYVKLYGDDIPDSVWEKLGKVRERLGISWGRGHAIAKEVACKGNPECWMDVEAPAPAPTQSFKPSELEYASAYWEYYERYGDDIPDSVWEKLGKVRERLGISWGRGHAVTKEVSRKGNPAEWNIGTGEDREPEVPKMEMQGQKKPEAKVDKAKPVEEKLREESIGSVTEDMSVGDMLPVSPVTAARSGRRQQAQQDLGLEDAREQARMERDMRQEEERRLKKEMRRMEIEQSSSYRMTCNSQDLF